jgi:hypothetical protein
MHWYRCVSEKVIEAFGYSHIKANCVSYRVAGKDGLLKKAFVLNGIIDPRRRRKIKRQEVLKRPYRSKNLVATFPSVNDHFALVVVTVINGPSRVIVHIFALPFDLANSSTSSTADLIRDFDELKNVLLLEVSHSVTP